jgi:hypothetical protein
MRLPAGLALIALALSLPGRGDAQALHLGGSVPARVAWRSRDIALAGAFTASLLIDASQTRALARGGWDGYHETNPILGPSPSVRTVNVYTAVVGLAVLGGAAVVPERVRPWLLGAALAVEAFTISHTAGQGVPIRLF